jgi:hypothetical protein
MSNLVSLVQVQVALRNPDVDNFRVVGVTVGGEVEPVIVGVDEFEIGSVGVYIRAGAWVPHSVAPWLNGPARTPRVFRDVLGYRLKKINLRGAPSHGILLPLDALEDAKGHFAMAVELYGHLIEMDELFVPDLSKMLDAYSYDSELAKELGVMEYVKGESRSISGWLGI